MMLLRLFKQEYFQTASEFQVFIFSVISAIVFSWTYPPLDLSVILATNPPSIAWCAAFLSPSLVHEKTTHGESILFFLWKHIDMFFLH